MTMSIKKAAGTVVLGTMALCALGAPLIADTLNGMAQRGAGQGAGITVRHLNDDLVPGFDQGYSGTFGGQQPPTPPTGPLTKTGAPASGVATR